MKALTSHRAAGVVTAAAFAASGAHIVTVVAETNPMLVALVYPLGIDGLIYVGIRALQERRVWPGILAVLVGAVYSFLFNADAENALKMDAYLIAASMPVCLVASYIIAYTGKRVIEHQCPGPERIEVPGPERVIYVDREVPEVTAADPVPALVGPEVPEDLPVPVSPAPARTRVPMSRGQVSWNVDLALNLIHDGAASDTYIGEQVGTSYKVIQRTRRAYALLRQSPDAQVPKEWKVPAVAVDMMRKRVRVP